MSERERERRCVLYIIRLQNKMNSSMESVNVLRGEPYCGDDDDDDDDDDDGDDDELMLNVLRCHLTY